MLSEFIVNYPEDMSIIENTLVETLAKILAKRLSEKDIHKFIELLSNDNTIHL